MLAGVDYVSRWVLGRPGAATILFVCFVGPALLLTPVVERVGQRSARSAATSPRRSCSRSRRCCSSWSRVGAAWWVYVATALVGVGYAGAQVFPIAMLPDAAAVDARRTGENRAGVFTGVWTAGETLGLALGPGVFALVLALGGYVSADQPDDWRRGPARLGGHGDRARLLAAARPCWSWSAWSSLSRYSLTRRRRGRR